MTDRKIPVDWDWDGTTHDMRVGMPIDENERIKEIADQHGLAKRKMAAYLLRLGEIQWTLEETGRADFHKLDPREDELKVDLRDHIIDVVEEEEYIYGDLVDAVKEEIEDNISDAIDELLDRDVLGYEQSRVTLERGDR